MARWARRSRDANSPTVSLSQATIRRCSVIGGSGMTDVSQINKMNVLQRRPLLARFELLKHDARFKSVT